MRSGKYTGTTETTKNLILDSAVIYVNYGEDDERKLGATRGGAEFTVEQEFREIEVDGARGMVKGNRRIVRVDAMINAELLEMSKENLLLAFPGASAEQVEEKNVITRNLTITNDDYFDNVTMVGTVSGSNEPVICQIKNSLTTGDFNLSTEDEDEGTTELEFEAHFDPAELEDDNFEEPWEVRYPVMIDLSLSTDEVEVATAEDEVVTYTTDPTDATVTAESDDDTIASVTVDEDEEEITITGEAEGNAIITVSATTDEGTVTEEIDVTVTE